MCGRFSIALPAEQLEEHFRIKIRDAEYQPIYNASPSQSLPVITSEQSKTLSSMHWGLHLPFARQGFPEVINTRSESVTKAFFHVLLLGKRCLIPADGFYEWQKSTRKIPFRFTRKDKAVFAFAGLYHQWMNDEGKEVRGFSIMTTTPNDLVKKVHDRMPVILEQKDEPKWLKGMNEHELVALLKPYDAKHLISYPVSDLVNNPRMNTSEVMRPIPTLRL